MRDRQRRGAVRGVVRARERQANDAAARAGARSGHRAPRAGRDDVQHAHVARGAPAERQAPIGAHVRGLRRDQRIGRRARPPSRRDRGPRTARPWRARCRPASAGVSRCAAPTLVMTPMCGPRDLGQVGDLAVPAHRHLQHPGRLVAGRGQDRERQADVGVEAAGGAADGAQRAQRRGAQLLGRGLAVRSGDADDQAAELAARGARHVAHRPPRIVGGDDRDAVASGGHAARARHDDAGRARGGGLRREVETVDALAREREEQLAGRDRAAVVVRAREVGAARPRLHDRAAHRARRPVQRAARRLSRRRRWPAAS